MRGALLPKSNIGWIARHTWSQVQTPQLSLFAKYSQCAQSEPPKEAVPEKGGCEMVFHQLAGFLLPQHHT